MRHSVLQAYLRHSSKMTPSTECHYAERRYDECRGAE
jgi:hypothetical protein